MQIEDLSHLTQEELERMSLIMALRKIDEETRLMREKYDQEREEREKERLEREAVRETERLRWEKEMEMRRERHEREMEKIARESQKIRMDWLLSPIIAAAAASGATITALKLFG
ncbi:MAG: hypothetical protein Q4B71_05125 [Cardiobacteriaceae bacterium]|nr:hypothetical protein [Cardiobacteriaceae bacterium]